MEKEYFPLWQATGDAFCNRVAERYELKQHLIAGRHTWLMAPRRYGKSSLIAQVQLELSTEQETQIKSYLIDLLPAYDRNSVQEIILNGVGRLMGMLESSPKHAIQLALKFLSKLKPEVAIDSSGIKVKLSPSNNPSLDIKEALLGLDQAASDNGIRAIFVMDEFQSIAGIAESHSIEASIRHAVERAKSVSYVFSGSNRHNLELMFEDSTRPLYHLCHQLGLERISVEDYQKHLQRLAQEKWQKTLDSETFTRVMELSERHPYYVNKLCSILWQSDQVPNEESTHKAWELCIQHEKSTLAAEIGRLSANQRAVLKSLAEEPTNQPRGKEFLNRSRMAGTSVSQALEVLLQNDLIYRDTGEYYQLLNPVMRDYFRDNQ